MAILKPLLNEPNEIALKFKTGKEVKGDYGPQMRFSLTSGDLLYVPLQVGNDIAALNLGLQEPFILTKLPKGAWSVERKLQPVAPRPQLVQVDKSNVKPKSKEELMTEFGELLVSGADIPEPKVNGNGQNALRMALRLVIDEAAEAEKYAASRGLSVRFDNCDIRAFVNTTLIGLQHAGGR